MPILLLSLWVMPDRPLMMSAVVLTLSLAVLACRQTSAVDTSPTATDRPGPEPAAEVAPSVHVTGRTLNINGTRCLPAGVFGSFNLPKGYTDRYRLAQDRRIDHYGLSDPPAVGSARTPMLINTYGDRIRPSHRLTDPQWRQKYQKLGRLIAQTAARQPDRTVYIEFWNEPYLNWANANRAGFIPRFFDEARAVEGGPVRVLHDGTEAPHLRWTREHHKPQWKWCSPRDWRRGRDADQNVWSVHAPPWGGARHGMEPIYGGPYNPEWHPPADVADGQTYTISVAGKPVELTAFTPWHIYDTTQTSYYAAKGMALFYNDPMVELGKSIRDALAEQPPQQRGRVVYIVGWGNRPSEDHWRAFENLYKDTIDRGIEYIDGVNDHDYGGDPRKMAGVYEFITAYGMTAHQKWLYGYNTETASMFDPETLNNTPWVRNDRVSLATLTPEQRRERLARSDRQKFVWFATKVLHLLQNVPDKVRSQAHFGGGPSWFSDGGEGLALDLLRELRGRIVEIERHGVPDDVLMVASIDGTDPDAPRPETPDADAPAADSAGPAPAVTAPAAATPGHRVLTLALFNPHGSETRAFPLRVTAPQGCRLLSRRWRGNVHDRPAELDDGSPMPPGGVAADRLRIALAPRQLQVLNYPLDGEPSERDDRAVVQRFLGPTLRPVAPDTATEAPITLTPADTDRMIAVSLRLVLHRTEPRHLMVRFNGRDLDFPPHAPAASVPTIYDLPLTPADLRLGPTGNRLSILSATDAPPEARPLLVAASLVLKRMP